MTPRPTRVPAAVVLVAAVLAVSLATCGSSTSTAPGAPSATPGASGADVGSGAPQGQPTDTPEPSVDRHGAVALEALLPDSIAGIALERVSLTGPDFYALGTDTTRKQLDSMLKELGKTVADLSVGDAGDPTGKAVLELGAFRVAGSAPVELLSAWVAARQAAGGGKIGVTNVTIAGRAVTKLVDPARPVGGVTYAYARGDTVLLMAADDASYLSEAIGKLPAP